MSTSEVVGSSTSVTGWGLPPWHRDEMVASLEEFAALYEQRPLRENPGGMTSSHLFLSWFVLRRLAPRAIVESGVWHGQGTWFFERACPRAQLHCVEPHLERIQYRSSGARYYDRDLSTIDWAALPEDTLFFIDDHQDAVERIKTIHWLGFKHMIFEDNYPPGRGDCYSLKQAFMEAGFHYVPGTVPEKIRGIARGLLQVQPKGVAANPVDAKYLKKNLEIYQELPPIFRVKRTRWGDEWSDERYPTPEPLLTAVEKPTHQVYLDEATGYTWICYAKLR